MNYHKPVSRKELLRLTAGTDFLKKGGALLAGGTDLVTVMEHGGAEPGVLIDLKGLNSLSGIKVKGSQIRIGALTTISQILESEALTEGAPILVEAAAGFAAAQIRNRATIGGNICNGSPAADLLPPLYTLKAMLKLESATGYRNVPVSEFFPGPGETVLKRGEILTEVSFNIIPNDTINFFYKLGLRESMAIAVVSVAGVYRILNSRYTGVRIALGAVAPTVIRAAAAEAALEGAEVSEESAREAGAAAAYECSPITDIRASARYRRLMVERLVEEYFKPQR